MEKPKFLYHGSCAGIDGALVPRSNDGDINGKFTDGPREVVFATHDKNLAILYTLKNKHMLSTGTHEGLNFSFILDHDAWRNVLDHSQCKLYTLPPETFTNTLNKDGTRSCEWQSRENVMPISSERYTPERVMETGAQLFCLTSLISKEQWHYDEKSPAESSFQNRLEAKHKDGRLPKDFNPLHLARELKDAGLLMHLNELDGINPIELPKHPQASVIQEDIEWLKEEMQKNQTWVQYVGAGLESLGRQATSFSGSICR